MKRPYNFQKILQILLELEQGTSPNGTTLEHYLLLSCSFATGQIEADKTITLHALTPRGERLITLIRDEKHFNRLKNYAARRRLPFTLTNIIKLHFLLRASIAQSR